MQAVIGLVIAGLLGGVAVGLQAPLASLIGQRLGSMESVFIVHLSGALASGVLLLTQAGGALARWHILPWYAALAGIPGIIIVSATNLVIPRLGATASLALIVSGQLLIGLLFDHFGLMGVTPRPVDLTRVVGVGLLFGGAFLIIR